MTAELGITQESLMLAGVICLARIGDVSIGTLRTIFVMRDKRLVAWVLGFFEVLIWILAAGSVISNLRESSWIVIVGYCVGYATGNWVGMTIEGRLALGERVIQLFTRRGVEVAQRFRDAGHVLTEIAAHGLMGPVQVLVLKVPRKDVEDVLNAARSLDEHCFYVVSDVRESAQPMVRQNRGLLRK